MTETDVQIVQRVSLVESGIKQLDDESRTMRGSIERLSHTVTTGFAEIRREVSGSKVPNWGLVISAASLLFVIGGAILVATARPLIQNDVVHDRAIEELTRRERESFEARIRLDERAKVLENTKGAR